MMMHWATLRNLENHTFLIMEADANNIKQGHSDSLLTQIHHGVRIWKYVYSLIILVQMKTLD